MAATSESEILDELKKVDERFQLRMREVAGWYRGIPNSTANKEMLIVARNQLQQAISTLLLVDWDKNF